MPSMGKPPRRWRTIARSDDASTQLGSRRSRGPLGRDGGEAGGSGSQAHGDSGGGPHLRGTQSGGTHAPMEARVSLACGH
jgi:hypothetical protein